MGRCGLFLFFIVVAIATRVANCEDNSIDFTTYGCGPNEVWDESGKYMDAICSPLRLRRRHTALYNSGRCECPEGFCRNESKECVPVVVRSCLKDLEDIYNSNAIMSRYIRDLRDELSSVKKQCYRSSD